MDLKKCRCFVAVSSDSTVVFMDETLAQTFATYSRVFTCGPQNGNLNGTLVVELVEWKPSGSANCFFSVKHRNDSDMPEKNYVISVRMSENIS